MKAFSLKIISLFYDSHFINQVTAITQLVDDEENVADIYCDTTLEVMVRMEVVGMESR